MLHGVVFGGVERGVLVGYFAEIDVGEAYASHIAVVHGAIIDFALRDVARHGPLGGTWHIGHFFAGGKLYAHGDVEII